MNRIILRPIYLLLFILFFSSDDILKLEVFLLKLLKYKETSYEFSNRINFLKKNLK